MAKVKVNIKNVETGGDLAVIKPGLYPAKLVEATPRTSRNGNEMVELVFEIRSGDYKGRKMWYYVVTDDESMEFRVAEMLVALGMAKEKNGKVTYSGSFDPEGAVGANVKLKTRLGKDQNGDDRGEVAKMLPDKSSDADDDDDDDGDDGEKDYGDMSLSELKDEVSEVDEDQDVDDIIGKKKGAKAKAALIEWLEENASDDDDDDDDGDSDDDDDNSDDDDDDDQWSREELEEMSDEDLETEAFEPDDDGESWIDPDDKSDYFTKKGKKKKLNRDKVIDAILESQDGDGDDDDDDDGDDDGDDDNPDYSGWSIQDLKDELEKRELKTGGKKSVLIARLEKDDESGDPF